MRKYYIDTYIWKDYFEDRKDKYNFLGEYANQFLTKIINDGLYLIISDIV